MDCLSPSTMVTLFWGTISIKCWMIKRPAQLLKQFSLIKIISTAVLLAVVVADLSGVFHAVDSAAAHFKLLTGAHLFLMEHQLCQLCFQQGIVHWRSEPVTSLPEVPHVPMTFDDSLPVIPPPSHLRQLIAHADAAHANKLHQHHSATGCGC